MKPVFFLVSQFEHLERFRVFGQEITLSFSTKEKLTGLIRENLNLTADDRLKYAHVLPVQIYGGLEFIGWDEAGNLLLDISESRILSAVHTDGLSDAIDLYRANPA